MLLLFSLVGLLGIALALVPVWPYNRGWNGVPSAATGLLAFLAALLVNFGYL